MATLNTTVTGVEQGWKFNKIAVFSLYWLLLFVVYLPTAGAGRVGDFPGWVEAITTKSFMDYVNRTGSGIASLYYFTQVVSYTFYQVFGANAWLWHILYITLQATNALLLFLFFSRLFANSSVNSALIAAFAGGVLFCLSPSISEAVVWEPAFHYLLGLLLMMLVLVCAQQFMITQKTSYALWGGIAFFCSTYCLEVFYLTPLFVLLAGIYYQLAGRQVLKKLLLYFSLPQASLFAFYFILLRVLYHQTVAHIGSLALQPNAATFSKPLKYLFHVLFLGRFFPQTTRAVVYRFCETGLALGIFYGLLALLAVLILTRYRKFTMQWQAAVLLLAFVLLSLGLITPLWLPETGLAIYDRYTYVLGAFVFMLMALVLANLLKKYIFIGAILVIALVNYRFLHKVNAYWRQSADVVNNLVATFPNDPSKKVLLVNLPECLDGVQMVGTRDDGEFRMLYNSVRTDKITNEVYDVEAFYMRSPQDGAHVNVVDDTTVRVTLNQWGTWWIYYGYGATSYENKDFKVVMRDQGHWYDLILKHPASEYLVLYCVGRNWHKADLDKKGVDQY
ncbi:MAG: hypothetical protein K0Q79_297 [Flavipsychrobacter sp.]|jgi:hypothetical protein|nr:hypothetical protein [Flavipsychrobacter sp.]